MIMVRHAVLGMFSRARRCIQLRGDQVEGRAGLQLIELTIKGYFVGATHEDHDLAGYLFLFPALFHSSHRCTTARCGQFTNRYF